MPTEIWSSWLSSRELAVATLGRKEEGEGRRKEGERGPPKEKAALIKSRDRHLTGGGNKLRSDLHKWQHEPTKNEGQCTHQTNTKNKVLIKGSKPTGYPYLRPIPVFVEPWPFII